MTFELSPQHISVRDRARAFAETLAATAVDIDRTASVSADVRRQVAELSSGDSLATVIAVEEIAVASAAVATAVAATEGGASLGLTGLRGATVVEASSRAQLVLSAVALGIGKAATAAALAELRRSTATTGTHVDKPHWVVADVATDLDAARLLTYKAARTTSDVDIAIARLLASAAATRAVDAAIRIVGPPALTAGSVVERLSRDVRAVSVLIGTEEEQRAVAAEGLFPQ